MPNRHFLVLPLMRRLVHGAFLLFCLFIGFRFYQFYQWAVAGGNYTPRPPSVEAFLPIGALVSLKQFLLTGQYDPLHPAGLTIFTAALVLAFLFRKGFCGWVCPVGFTSELLHCLTNRATGHLRRSKRPYLLRLPQWLDYPLPLLKYLLLGFFLYLILWKMDLAALENFSRSPYSITTDARMLFFFLHPSVLALGIMTCLVILSIVLRNFWCRYLCPYGALLGLLALAGPLQVTRDQKKCIDCKKCEDICPAAIKITAKKKLISPECIGCLECVARCPQEDCLTLTALFTKKLSPFLLPCGLLSLFFTFWLAAKYTGHWQSSLTDDVFKHFYQMIHR
ncbi:MAG: 4Fe-4S binding protein [Proteobacteria bacterium]|nr:4Fe-4S binding protein [Pseudomonadota bacterium]MBU4297772.1 4Fe-4S binding protein [Pseudomonadota bacterium]MCG2748307.1 4Fe-4S binding protein [Desulfobulbaceae bacterium]